MQTEQLLCWSGMTVGVVKKEACCRVALQLRWIFNFFHVYTYNDMLL